MRLPDGRRFGNVLCNPCLDHCDTVTPKYLGVQCRELVVAVGEGSDLGRAHESAMTSQQQQTGTVSQTSPSAAVSGPNKPMQPHVKLFAKSRT